MIYIAALISEDFFTFPWSNCTRTWRNPSRMVRCWGPHQQYPSRSTCWGSRALGCTGGILHCGGPCARHRLCSRVSPAQTPHSNGQHDTQTQSQRWRKDQCNPTKNVSKCVIISPSLWARTCTMSAYLHQVGTKHLKTFVQELLKFAKKIWSFCVSGFYTLNMTVASKFYLGRST